MIKVKYNKWNNLPVGKYIELVKLASSDANMIDTVIKQMAILTDTDEDAILALPLEDYTKLKSGTAFLLEQPTPNLDIPHKVKLGKNKYKIITDISKLTAGQYIDLQSYINLYNKDMSYLPHLLSIFIIKNKYGENTEAIIEDIKNNMNTELALSLSAFFFVTFKLLIGNIKNSLVQEMKMKLKKETEEEKREKLKQMIHQAETDFLTNGDGSIQ